MRRALVSEWPALTRFYGLMPWHVSQLTVEELNGYRRQLADHVAELRRAERKTRRRRR